MAQNENLTLHQVCTLFFSRAMAMSFIGGEKHQPTARWRKTSTYGSLEKNINLRLAGEKHQPTAR
jgi:hypothetical protein